MTEVLKRCKKVFAESGSKRHYFRSRIVAPETPNEVLRRNKKVFADKNFKSSRIIT